MSHRVPSQQSISRFVHAWTEHAAVLQEGAAVTVTVDMIVSVGRVVEAAVMPQQLHADAYPAGLEQGEAYAGTVGTARFKGIFSLPPPIRSCPPGSATPGVTVTVIIERLWDGS
jgi:hypothetical protein